MTISDWAAWVQAIFSVIAIVIAIWLSHRQHKSSLEILREEHRLARVEVTRSLLSLSTNSLRLLKYCAGRLPNREAVHNIAEGRAPHLDVNELRLFESAIYSIPFYTLPHQLVSPAFMIGSTVRQFRDHIELVLKVHRQMGSDEFEDFFSNISKMQKSLKQTCDEIQVEVTKLETNA